MSAKVPCMFVDRGGIPVARAMLTRGERRAANRRMQRMYYRWVVVVKPIKPVKAIKPVKPASKQVMPASKQVMPASKQVMPASKQVMPAPRTFTFDPYHVTEHAIKRFKLRTGCVKSDASVARRVNDLAKGAKPVQLKKRFRVTTLLNHKVRPVEYRSAGGLIFVISLDKSILTIHKGEAKRWEAIK